ncbi:polysaccharide deacetylase family protein [Paenibacillus sp. GP183]|uniref:polysaccharide deacetylase family protein n=1 Tax=Paenibacillus sp. GP183 TaxID=1882751 RepID=UPI00089AAD14|nr:polysaccharide deacetylase family protein [Paenibacillus sp. GP183]SEB78934.1 peptidoglycan-N-acetylmuramic acid deacetylase [Paenibacillus sp. GP183]
MKKSTWNLLLVTLLSTALAGCSNSTQDTASASTQKVSVNVKETAAPSPTSTIKPVVTPSQSITPTQTPNDIPSASPSAAPVQSTAVKPVAAAKSGTSEKAALSWYYLKKKTGQVPDFPKETKSFTSGQKAVWIGKGKKVYLTIDAGGPLIEVDMMLKALKDNDVKANFFIAGYNIKQNPDYLKRLVNDGHFIANHTMTHKDLTLLTDDQVKSEITDFEKMYKEITGKEVEKYFRFPYGKYSMHDLSLISSMGYTSVFWSTAMKDWEPRKNGADDPYNDIMNNLHDGNIILMHQGSKENMQALDRIIKAVKKAGYEFGTVNELSPN